jgi:hypothetical protein
MSRSLCGLVLTLQQEYPVKKGESRDSTALACVTSASLSGECDGVAGTPPIADHPKRLDLACSQKPRGETSPGSWGHDNLRRFRKWCISSLRLNHLLNGPSPTNIGLQSTG